MVAALFLATLLQQQPARDSTRAKGTNVTIAIGRDSTQRRPLTPELLADAFADPTARTLVERARAARLAQDSSILRYDATSNSRASFFMRTGTFAGDRLVFRQDRIAHVRWERGVGARIELQASRAASAFEQEPSADTDIADLPPIPYFPGRDPLVLGARIARSTNDRGSLIHPLSDGSEAYYRFATGDSITLQLGASGTVRLFELRIRPREASWNLAIGSIWLDARTFQVVRVAYRLASPVTIDDAQVSGSLALKFLVKRVITPMSGEINSITAEYALHEGRFWLPAVEILDANAQIGRFKLRVRLQQSYDFAEVNGSLPVTPFAASTDSFPADSSRTGRRREAVRKQYACKDTSGVQTRVTQAYDKTLPVSFSIPCDTAALRNSAALPGTFSQSDARFETMIREDLSAALDVDPPINLLQPFRLHWSFGDGRVRFNRVEGLSAGVDFSRDIGRGTRLAFAPRIGTSDLVPNAALRIEHARGNNSTSVTAYRRLSPVNDWTDPLSFGSSLSAFVLGRDEGFYYRTLGAEVLGTHTGSTPFEIRLFAERQTDAPAHNPISLSRVFGADFDPNIRADSGDVYGAAIRLTRTIGYNPARPRIVITPRIEAARGDFDYIRAAADVSLTIPLSNLLLIGLRGSAGGSLGSIPQQRLFFIGGPLSVRGYDVGDAIGLRYRSGSVEISRGSGTVRPVIFVDAGRARRNLLGAGIGLSIADGLVRAELSKGLQPEGSVRFSFYLN